MNHVLFVDDEPHLLEGLRRLVRTLGFECECRFASDGVEALAEARRSLPDLIVTDMRMPQMGGLELLANLKADPFTQRVPVIVLTGHGDAQAKHAALEAGAHDFIDKPAIPAEFAARLRSLFKIKEYEDKLRERNRLLEQQVMQLQKMENIGFLAAGLSHDLNNMLAALVGHMELAGMDTGISERTRERLRTASEALTQAGGLVRQLITMSRPSVEDYVVCDMGSLVSEGLSLLRVSIRPNIAVEWKRPESEMRVRANPLQIHQVLLNLCINAVHAMPSGGTLSIIVNRQIVDAQPAGSPPPGAYVRLIVADTGIGMDEATRARVFEPYFTTRPEGKGTGLGLPVVERIVLDHGGKITVESRPGEGTRFTVIIPAAVGSPAGTNPAQKEGAVDVQTANTVRG